MQRKLKLVLSISLVLIFTLGFASLALSATSAQAYAAMRRATAKQRSVARYAARSVVYRSYYNKGVSFLRKANTFYRIRKFSTAYSYARGAYNYFAKIRTGSSSSRLKRKASASISRAESKRRAVYRYVRSSAANRRYYSRGYSYLKSARSYYSRRGYKRSYGYANNAYNMFSKIRGRSSNNSLQRRASAAITRAGAKQRSVKRYAKRGSSNWAYFRHGSGELFRARKSYSRRNYSTAYTFANRAYTWFSKISIRRRPKQGFRRRAALSIRRAKNLKKRVRRFRKRSRSNRRNFRKGNRVLRRARRAFRNMRYHRAIKRANRAYSFFRKVRRIRGRRRGRRRKGRLLRSMMRSRARGSIKGATAKQRSARRYANLNRKNRSNYRAGSSFLAKARVYYRRRAYSNAYKSANRAATYFNRVRPRRIKKPAGLKSTAAALLTRARKLNMRKGFTIGFKSRSLRRTRSGRKKLRTWRSLKNRAQRYLRLANNTYKRRQYSPSIKYSKTCISLLNRIR